MLPSRTLITFGLLAGATACTGAQVIDAGINGPDSSVLDGGTSDSGVDAGRDPGVDAGRDAGVDGGTDAGACSLTCGSACCRYGELCGADAGCFSDYDPERRPYCDSCDGGGTTRTCGLGSNYCLVGSKNLNNFCGADCSQGQSCPNGYSCSDVTVLATNFQCSASVACPGSRQCITTGGSSFGSCECQGDMECPQESCSAGECSITRTKCVTDPDCHSIRCVTATADAGSRNACLLGRNCMPAPGLTCLEVK